MTTNVDSGLRPLLVDAKQAARLLGIGRTTLYELIKVGAVATVHIGRCVRFSVTELERFVASGGAITIDCGARPKSEKTTPRHRAPRHAPRREVDPRLFEPAD